VPINLLFHGLSAQFGLEVRVGAPQQPVKHVKIPLFRARRDHPRGFEHDALQPGAAYHLMVNRINFVRNVCKHITIGVQLFVSTEEQIAVILRKKYIKKRQRTGLTNAPYRNYKFASPP